MGLLRCPLIAPTTVDFNEAIILECRGRWLAFLPLDFSEICAAALIEIMCFDRDEAIRLEYGSHSTLIPIELGLLYNRFPKLVWRNYYCLEAWSS